MLIKEQLCDTLPFLKKYFQQYFAQIFLLLELFYFPEFIWNYSWLLYLESDFIGSLPHVS